MKLARHLPVLAAATLAASSTNAQFVKGNEAVRTLADGRVQVETAPLPKTVPHHRFKLCLATATCNAGPWFMVETAVGLMECTEAYARPGSCRKSTYGTVRRARLWVVKTGGLWLQCQYPDLGSKCVNMFAPFPANLPYDAVQ